MDGNEPQAMSEDLILHNGCVVVHQDFFHSHGWHLPNKTESLIYKDLKDSAPIPRRLTQIGRDLFLEESLIRSLQMSKRNAQQNGRKNKP